MIERRCENCHWWQVGIAEGRTDIGLCKAAPPTQSCCDRAPWRYQWPITNMLEWCGAFQPRESLRGGVDVRVKT